MHACRSRRITAALFLLLLIQRPSFAQSDVNEQQATATLSRAATVSTAVSTVTSVAISPLLGVCVFGAWDYFRTPAVQRVRLPFYSFPVFWIPVGILLILIFIKDTVGGFAPLIKKPLDAIEVLLLNKASLILIGFPVLFHQIERIAGAHSVKQLFSAVVSNLGPVVYAAGSAPAIVDKAGHVTLDVLAILLGSASLIVVWLFGHSIDVLLLLSPFPFLDVLLKGFRVVVFAVVVGTSLISRTAGLALSLVIILICALCAGWTLRLTVFGSVFAWEILRTMVLGLKRKPDAAGVKCFSVGRGLRIPKRTLGKLVLSPENKLEFRYRRMGFGPTRRVALPNDNPYEIGRGLLHPSLIVQEGNPSKHRVLFRMLPGYRGSEESLRQALAVRDICDIRVPRGLRAFWRWLNDTGEVPAT